MPPFCSRVPGMGCLFCKKLEPGPKENAGLEGDFKSYGAAERYGPDPTQARPAPSLTHIPNYNNFTPQPTSPAFLNSGAIRGVSGESRGLETGASWVLRETEGRGDVELSLEASRLMWERQL